MLKQRILTIICLVPLVLALIFYASMPIITVVVALLTLIGAYEWCGLLSISQLQYKAVFMAVIATLMIISDFYAGYFIFACVLLWPVMIAIVVSYPSSRLKPSYRYISLLCAMILLPAFFKSLLILLSHQRSLLLYVFLIVWAADIGAYVSGKLLGKHKLIPNVSPGKTIEGVLGGLVLASIVIVCGFYWQQARAMLPWFTVCFMVAIFSILGDLSISLFKREAKLKDSGHLFPGHGGMLDRIDSLLAALPLFIAGVKGFNLL